MATFSLEPSVQGPVSRTSRELFGPEKLVIKLQSARFEKLIFLHAFNMRKIKRIAKFEGLEPRRCEGIKGIVVPDIGPKSFGTFEKQAPGFSADFSAVNQSVSQSMLLNDFLVSMRRDMHVLDVRKN